MSDNITAVLVNYNRKELLLRSLESLVGQSIAVSRIVLVDNGSTDRSKEAVVHAFPMVEVVSLTANIGSAGGFHRGIEVALGGSGNDILILDSDVVLDRDCVGALRSQLRVDSRVGVAGPKIYRWGSSTHLQEFGGWVDWAIADLRRNFFGYDESKGPPVVEDCDVDYVPACCVLIRRSAMEKAGNFEPGWFLYWDDIEWCSRVRKAGFVVKAVASATVQHFGGGANKASLLPVYYGWRNRVLYFISNAPADDWETTLRALFSDFLLARFTCRSLGLSKTANIMELAIDDALRGVFGKKDFSAIDLTLDPAIPVDAGAMSRLSEIVPVHHVIGSATADLAARPGVCLRDRFGKQLSAKRAFELQEVFVGSRAHDLAELMGRVAVRDENA